MSEKTAGRLDIQMRTNETFRLHLTYKDANNLPIDLTGWTAKMQVRDKPGGAVLILDSAAPNNSVTITGIDGTVDVEFAMTSMLAVTASRGVYDVALTDPAGLVDVIVEGTVMFVDGVTL